MFKNMKYLGREFSVYYRITSEICRLRRAHLKVIATRTVLATQMEQIQVTLFLKAVRVGVVYNSCMYCKKETFKKKSFKLF
jgi:hypothetical protein